MTSKIKVNILADGGDNSIITSDGAGSFTASSGLASSVQSVGGIQNTPAFSVRFNGTNSTGHSHNSITKVPFNTEDFDTDNAFDISSNYRFTVPSGKAGKYFFYGQVSTKGASNAKRRSHYTWLYKNDSAVAKRGLFGTTQIFEGGQETITDISRTLDLSVGDYVDLRVQVYDNLSGDYTIVGDTPNCTYFTGYKLIGA